MRLKGALDQNESCPVVIASNREIVFWQSSLAFIIVQLGSILLSEEYAAQSSAPTPDT